jgi:hypothetical protein
MKKFTLHYSYSYLLRQHKHRAAITVQRDRIHFKTQLYKKAYWSRVCRTLDTYATSDRDHQNENDNTIFDLYSENQNGAIHIYTTEQCGTYSVEGDCYNRARNSTIYFNRSTNGIWCILFRQLMEK